jgi:hypothetical protein
MMMTDNDPEELEFQIDQAARLLEDMAPAIHNQLLVERAIDWLRTPIVMRARINTARRTG